jgi:ketosteroid isomerase-like protein
MSEHDDLLAADRARRAAMIAADVPALAALLADDLIWTHSSGKIDDKAALLATIESGAVVYQVLEVEGTQVRQRGDVFVLQGTLRGRVSKDGAERPLNNRFLSVWQRGPGGFEMLAWQSTGI